MRTCAWWGVAIVMGLVLSGCGGSAQSGAQPGPQPAAQAAAGEADAAKTLEALTSEVERLKSIAPTQSHVMADAAIQAGSLWFAAQQKNWPLATFYFNETRGRIRWMIRINPTPKVSGQDETVDLQGIFDGIDADVLTPLKAAIDAKDNAKFEAGYRQMLESCYACHKSAGRPYLRPMIPTVPPQPVINADPSANWPH